MILTESFRLFSILGFSVWLDLWGAAVVLANKSASQIKDDRIQLFFFNFTVFHLHLLLIRHSNFVPRFFYYIKLYIKDQLIVAPCSPFLNIFTSTWGIILTHQFLVAMCFHRISKMIAMCYALNVCFNFNRDFILNCPV